MARLHQFVRKWLLPSLLSLNVVLTIFSLFLGNFISNVAATNGTVVSVEPALNTKNPNQYFTVNVTIANVTDLTQWQIKMRWKRGLLRTHFDNITVGPFLEQGGTTFPIKSTDEISKMDVTDILFSPPGVSGNGTLMSATFKVLDTGNTTLEIFFSELKNSTGSISHSVINATFYTTFPVGDFSYSPHPIDYPGHPIAGETITFNATTSYDPDDPYDSSPGGIVSYGWDFDDGTTGTGPIINHTYSDLGKYTVALNVTDDDGESYIYDISESPLEVKLHDIAAINLTVTPITTVAPGSTFTINATFLNEGSVKEDFNITLYYNSGIVFIPIETKTFTRIVEGAPQRGLPAGENGTITFSWTTTGVPEGSYLIGVSAYLINSLNISKPLEGVETDTADNTRFYMYATIAAEQPPDIAVTGIEVTRTSLRIGQFSKLVVTIVNKGNVDINFNATITIQYGSETTPLSPKSNETLFAGATVKLEFPTWIQGGNNTKEGNYNVTVSIVPVNRTTLDFLTPYNSSVPDEDPTDNNMTKPLPPILMLPVAYFTPSATKVNVDQVIVFNATQSYAPGIPGGSITEYTWDFGDGVKVTQTSPIATHIYKTDGTFTVTLKVTDDVLLTGNTTKVMTVNPFRIIAITHVTFSPHILASGGLVSINVTVNARLRSETFNLTAYFGENEIDTLHNQTLAFGSSATYTFPWDTTGVAGGNYTIKALVTNRLNTTHTENTTYIAGIITIQKITITLTLTASLASFTVGETTTISGTTSPALANANVAIQYRLSSEDTWQTVADAQTDSNGAYSQTWTPAEPGTYTIKSVWQGDDTTALSESQVSIIIVQEVPPLNLFLYLSVALVIAIITMAFYFLKIWKPKPK